jgi:hypothetical protein
MINSAAIWNTRSHSNVFKEMHLTNRKPGSWVRIPHKARMFGVRMRLFCVRVVLCLGRGLATSWSPTQGVLPSVKMIKETDKPPLCSNSGSEKKIFNKRGITGTVLGMNWTNWTSYLMRSFGRHNRSVRDPGLYRTNSLYSFMYGSFDCVFSVSDYSNHRMIIEQLIGKDMVPFRPYALRDW